MERQTFSQHSEFVAANFLQTVVVLDDQAFFQPREEIAEELKEPSLRAAASDDSDPSREDRSPSPRSEDSPSETPDESADPVRAIDAVDNAHDLYAKTVIDSFGKKGLICSVFRPSEDENAPEDFFPALKRADLVVLDWVIHKDDGKAALSAIKKLSLSSETGERQGLRLIAVYTGQSGLRDIAKRICAYISEAEVQANLSEDECTVNTPTTAICVLAKPEANVPSDLASRVVSFEELPSRLIREFAFATSGLIPNLLLSSLSALRESTHVLLHQLSRDLDAAFLAHQCLLEQPEDGRQLALQLIADEFKAILDEYGVIESISLEVVESWLSEKHPSGLNVTLVAGGGKPQTCNVPIEKASKLLTNGYLAEKGTLNLPKDLKNNLTKLFLTTEDDTTDLDNHFAMLTSCKSRYKLQNPIPTLTLGTILFCEEGDQSSYFLCILPVCDSVRLTGARAFPFLPLSIDSSKIFFVARQKETFLNFRIHDAPFDCVMKTFKPKDGEKAIKATLKDQEFSFKDEDGRTYHWVGELKFAQAQRAVSNFAANLSRVGLDESEWLRLKRSS